MSEVVIDARMIGVVPHGIARYVKNLADGLAGLSSLKYEPVFLVSSEGRSRIPDVFRTITVDAPFLSARELLEIPRVLKRAAPALYHSPSFSSLIHSPCPWIVTIHDLNHLRFGGLKQKIYYQTLLKSFARGAKRVITVSEFSQREISEWLGVPANQIEIVYNAVDPAFCEDAELPMPASLLKFHLKAGSYFLFISHHSKSKAHKNSEMLLRAYREAKRRAPALAPLVLNATAEEVDELLPRTSGVIPVGKISDEELRFLQQHARAVLFPSVYEGFGLPALEAAMLGSPVLVSDIPPHREALVDFSPPQIQWLRPSDREVWTQALVRLKARSPTTERRSDPEQLARAQARYSVRALADHMDQIYRSVLELSS